MTIYLFIIYIVGSKLNSVKSSKCLATEDCLEIIYNVRQKLKWWLSGLRGDGYGELFKGYRVLLLIDEQSSGD